MAKNVKPRQIKFSKVAIVMFLTVLIWVYADLALDDTHLVPDVRISIAASGDSELWATFKNEDGAPASSIAIEYIKLKGPASRVAEVKRDLNSGFVKFDFSLNPVMQKMTIAGSHSLNVLDFVRRSEQIRGLGGLAVESCEPNTVTVEVVKLERKDLGIQSVDENGRTLEFETIGPSQVNMFVPEDWGQDKGAEVRLTQAEIEKARSTAIGKTPYVVLADGQTRHSDTLVQVKLRRQEDELGMFIIRRVREGYTYSVNTQGKYRASMQESDALELRKEIKIRATLEAKNAYENQSYQVIVEIEDTDDSGEPRTRAPKYNFPEQYVRAGEIRLDLENEAREAKFKLVPVPTGDGP